MTFSFHEKRNVGLLLTFIGGAVDSYTYIHYDAFASAQTGNIVLMIIQAFDGKWLSVGTKILSTCFFFLGILLTKFLIDYFKKKEQHFWRLYILYFEAIMFLLIGLAPLNIHPALVTILIAFTASVQWVSFDKINGRVYTNVFTTGNLKGAATSFYDYAVSKDHTAFEEFIHYLLVVFAFVFGAAATVFCYHLFAAKAIFMVSILIFLLACLESFKVWRFYQESGLKNS